MTGGAVMVALLAVVVGSLLKSATGIGLPLVAVPAIALLVGMQEAVVLVAMPNVLLNALLAWRERSAFDATRDLGRLCATAAVGAVAGTVLLVSVPPEPLLVLLAVMVLGYAAVAVGVPDLAVNARTSQRWAPAVGVSAGFLQGAIGISGPLLATWLHSYRLPRRAYMLSVSLLFVVAGITQSVLLLAGDRLAGRWTAALLVSIPAVLTVPLGTRLRDRLRPRAFDRVVLTTLVVSTLVLVAETFG